MFYSQNLTQVQAATGYDYPIGSYIFKIVNVDKKPNSDGNGERVVINNEIEMGPGPTCSMHNGKHLINSYQDSQKGAPFFKRFVLSCGIDDAFIASQGGSLQLEWLIGRRYVGTVAKKDNFLNIVNEKPLDSWNMQPAPKAAAVNAPAPSLLQPMQQAQMPQQQMPTMQQQMPVMQQQMPMPQMPAQQAFNQPGLPPTQLPPVAQAPQMVGFQAPPPPPGQIGR